jgi:hypothetical protein
VGGPDRGGRDRERKARTAEPQAHIDPCCRFLAAARALAVYSALVNAEPVLLQPRNTAAQPVIEFRGLGERPAAAPAAAARSGERLELLLRMEVPPIPADIWRLAPHVPPD